MIQKILAALTTFTISVISTTGYWGIVLLMAIESACIPLPSEIIMPFAGALTVPAIAAQYGRETFSLWWVATAGAIGCNVGSIVAYEIGYYGGRPLVERFGSWILITRHELEMADRFFARFGNWAVFISRLLPVIRTFIALPAGVARMPRIPFHIYTFLGSWPWCLGLAYVGQVLGERWNTDPRLKQWFHSFDAVIGIALLAGVIWFVRSRWKGRIVVREASADD
jgi:membrane protein DedA with SNARE-associated domain